MSEPNQRDRMFAAWQLVWNQSRAITLCNGQMLYWEGQTALGLLVRTEMPACEFDVKRSTPEDYWSSWT